jgi:hypothetical protein
VSRESFLLSFTLSSGPCKSKSHFPLNGTKDSPTAWIRASVCQNILINSLSNSLLWFLALHTRLESHIVTSSREWKWWWWWWRWLGGGREKNAEEMRMWHPAVLLFVWIKVNWRVRECRWCVSWRVLLWISSLLIGQIENWYNNKGKGKESRVSIDIPHPKSLNKDVQAGRTLHYRLITMRSNIYSALCSLFWNSHGFTITNNEFVGTVLSNSFSVSGSFEPVLLATMYLLVDIWYIRALNYVKSWMELGCWSVGTKGGQVSGWQAEKSVFVGLEM